MSVNCAERIFCCAKAMRTAPCFIADVFGVCPERVERLLLRRGQRCGEGESLRDYITQHYNKCVADELAALIHGYVHAGGES